MDELAKPASFTRFLLKPIQLFTSPFVEMSTLRDVLFPIPGTTLNPKHGRKIIHKI